MIQHGDHTELQDEGQHDLLGFWSAVEELRRADRTLWHQLATEIFYGYVNKPTDDGAGVQGAMLPLIQFRFRSSLLFEISSMWAHTYRRIHPVVT